MSIQQSWVVITETIWPIKPDLKKKKSLIYILYDPLQKKVSDVSSIVLHYKDIPQFILFSC